MRALGLLVLLFASPALAQTASPVPTTMPEDGAPPSTNKPDTFDADAAKKVLSGVEYKDCGKGGPGKLLVTFSTDGTVERVVLAEGSWQPPVAICVTRRFSEIGVAPFTGSSHTVKWSVALDGGPPPAATYATPPPAPIYPLPYGGPDVIDASNGPPPSGYHVEERRRSSLLISGSIIGGFGIVFTALGLDSDSGSRDGRETMLVAGIVHLAIGIPLFCVGLSSKRVFVANNVSFAPQTLTLHF
jgi:hypothetical protein